MGVGGNLVVDRTSIYQQLYFSGNYGYEVKLGKANYLRFGMAAGFHQQSIDFDGVVVEDMTDLLLSSTVYFRANSFVADAGVNWRYRKLYVGLAANRLLSTNSQFYINEENRGLQKDPHLVSLVSYRFESPYNPDFVVVPSVVLRTVAAGPNQLDAQVLLRLKKKITVGFGYRHQDATRMILGYKINRFFAAAYTYDFASMGIARSSGGSHEIMISFFNNPIKAPVIPAAKLDDQRPISRNRREEDATITKARDPQKVFKESGYHIIFGQFNAEAPALELAAKLDEKGVRYEVIQSNMGTWFVLSPTVFATKVERVEYEHRLEEKEVQYSWRFVAGE